MNATTAALCTKPALGVALYLLSLCANNQALRDVFVDLGRVGPVVTQDVVAPMDEAYELELWRVPKVRNGTFDHAREFACSGGQSALSLTLRVSHGDEPATESRTFTARCPARGDADRSLVALGQVVLRKGVSHLVIVNEVAVALPDEVRLQVLLVGNGVAR